MKETKLENMSTTTSEETLVRAKHAKAMDLLRKGVAASAMVLAGTQGLAACNADSGSDSNVPAEQQASSPNVPSPGVENDGKTDWAQYEGSRNTSLVAFHPGGTWTEVSQCTNRFCNQTVDVFLKVFVKPVQGANLDQKRIGVVYRLPNWEAGRDQTALGTYFNTGSDGMEEWHVRVRMNSSDWPRVLVFNAWYQDGTGHTYYDDNNGEFHVANGNPGGSGVLSQSWCCIDEATDVKVTDAGVEGQIGLQVADIDYDKAIQLYWTTDDWQTVNVSELTGGTDDNHWHWVRDFYAGYDLFKMHLNIPGQFQKFEYAIVYKHGVVNNAQTYEFWDNNGGYNYVVTKQAPPDLTNNK